MFLCEMDGEEIGFKVHGDKIGFKFGFKGVKGGRMF